MIIHPEPEPWRKRGAESEPPLMKTKSSELKPEPCSWKEERRSRAVSFLRQLRSPGCCGSDNSDEYLETFKTSLIVSSHLKKSKNGFHVICRGSNYGDVSCIIRHDSFQVVDVKSANELNASWKDTFIIFVLTFTKVFAKFLLNT